LDVNGNVKADKFIGDGSLLTNLPGGAGGGISSITAGAGLSASPSNPITSSGTLSISSGGVTNTMLQNSSLTITPADTSLSGGGTITLGGSSSTLKVNTSVIQTRVTGNCGGISAIQTVNGDGTVGCVAVGGGGGGGIGGSGTANSIPKFTGATTLGDSQISDDGSNVIVLVGGSGDGPGGIQLMGAALSPVIVGGFYRNSATAGGTVGGGGTLGAENRVFDEFGTVAGGQGNIAGLPDATNQQSEATVSGGAFNTASNAGATVSGGHRNTASGPDAMIPGGADNAAAGSKSFAAGTQAKANHSGSFVWADSFVVDFASTAANQFNVRASGGVRIFSNSTLTAGVTLAPGGGSWATVSDRNAKENFDQVDGRVLLDKLNAIAVESWNYKAQNKSIRHMGPMAQDFYAAFGLGEDDRHISTVDADGVALAGVQALYRMLLQQNDQIQKQQQELQDLRDEMKRLQAIQK
jgi:Chaperone of endosialidase